MRRSPRTLVVDCGAAHLALARFGYGGSRRIELCSLAVDMHASEPGPAGSWTAALAEALAEARAQHRVCGPCRVGIPGHIAFTKLVPAPPGNPAQRRAAHAQVVAGVVPSALDDLVWTAQEAPENGPGSDLIVAVARATSVSDLGAGLVASGFEPTGFEPTLLALARAYRFNYAGASEPTLLLDVGARSTNLLLVAGDGRFRLRTLTLGGNALTLALAEATQVGFHAAEARKRLAVESGDPAGDEAVAAAAETWLRRLQFEIGRTLAALAGSEEWPAPTRVLLTGGASAWPGLDARLGSGFGLMVETYDPLRGIAIAAGVDRAFVAAQRPYLPVLVGLAAVAVDVSPAPCDLLPPELGARQRFRRRRPVVLATALLVTAVIAGAAIYARAIDDRVQHELAGVRSVQDSLRARIAEAAAAHAADAALRSGNAQLQRWIDDRGNWAAWLARWQQCLGPHGDVWLERFRVREISTDAVGSGLGIEIGGWLLDLRHPLEMPGLEALGRLQEVLADLSALPNVAEIVNVRHDGSRPGVLGFACTVMLVPEHRL